MNQKKYTLMHKKEPVVEFVMEDCDIISINQVFNTKHLPVGIEQFAGKPVRASLNRWWQRRSIPISRSGLEEGLEILGVGSSNELLDKSYGLSLSDQYWINPKSNPLEWEKINFFDHDFSDDVGNALFGELEKNQDIDYISPCSASDGWLKKKWKIIYDKRVLVKGGSGTLMQEPYNELIATSIHQKLNLDIPYTAYEIFLDGELPYSLCDNFITKDTELITGMQLINSEKKKNDLSYYEHLIKICKMNGLENIEHYLDYMIVTDYMIANTDRHFNNFGVIRDANTLEYKNVAPIFDSGTSLWFDIPEKYIDFSKEIKAKPFKKTQKEQLKLVKNFDWLDFNKLRDIDQEVYEIFSQSQRITPERRDILCFGIKNQIKELEQIACEQQHSIFVESQACSRLIKKKGFESRNSTRGFEIER